MAGGKSTKCKDSQHPSCPTHRPQVVHSSSYRPVHRESLVIPQHTTILPRVVHTEQAMDAPPNLWGALGRGSLRRVSHVDTNVVEPDESSFPDWLSPWCQEPPGGDADTCCLGFWVPSALFGKTHWRLNTLSYDRDDKRRTWKPAMGCNGMCWVYCAVACFLTPCVAGNAIFDFLISYFG